MGTTESNWKARKNESKHYFFKKRHPNQLQKTANDRDVKIVEKQKKNIQGEQESEAKKAPSLTSDSAK